MARKTKKRDKREENKRKDIDNMTGGVVGHVYNLNAWRWRTRSYKLIILALEASLGYRRPPSQNNKKK